MPALQIHKASNSWIVFEIYASDYKRSIDELRDLLSEYNANRSPSILAEFHDFDKTNALDAEFRTLHASLQEFKITRCVYALPQSSLAEIVWDFLKKNVENGLHNISPRDSLINGAKILEISGKVKANRRRMNQETREEYWPAIWHSRNLFSNAGVKKNVIDIVDRFYCEPRHKWKHNFFDREGARLYSLYHKRSEWYSLGNGYYGGFPRSLVISIGAFGFNDFNGILAFALSQIELAPLRLEEKHNWGPADYILKDCVTKRLDCFHLVCWLTQRRLHSQGILLDLLPIADLIPGGLFLFSDLLKDDDVKYDLETHYPNLPYTEILS